MTKLFFQIMVNELAKLRNLPFVLQGVVDEELHSAIIIISVQPIPNQLHRSIQIRSASPIKFVKVENNTEIRTREVGVTLNGGLNDTLITIHINRKHFNTPYDLQLEFGTDKRLHRPPMQVIPAGLESVEQYAM